MTIKTVAIVTASSASGKACLETLLANPDPPKINALFRTQAKANIVREAYPDANIHLVTGIDAADPTSLGPGLSGCHAALIVTPFDPAAGMIDDAQLVLNMINASVEAGVKHIVFVGSWTVNAPEQCNTLASRFLPGEARLKEVEAQHGITWTVLRGGFFQINYTEFMAFIKDGELRFFDFCVPTNDAADIGRVAAAVLRAPKEHHGKCYEISGPDKLWLRDAVKIISEVTGREIKFVDSPFKDCAPALPQFLQEAYKFIVEGGEDSIPMSDDVYKVTGKKAKSFREWAMENREMFVA